MGGTDLERIITNLYRFLILAGLCLCVYAGIRLGNVTFSETGTAQARNWTNSLYKEYTDAGLVYTGTLPEGETHDRILAFDTHHTETEVLIGDTVVYSLKAKDGAISRTTGYSWNYVHIKKEYGGEPITIRLNTIYKNQDITEASIYYGDQGAISGQITKENLFHFVVSLLILTIGIAMFFYAYFIAERNTANAVLKHFTIFTLLLGTWALTGSSLCALLIPYGVALAFLTHISLMLMPIPFLLFIRTTCQDKEHPLWYVYCMFNCAIVFIRLLLQLTGICDLLETLWLTHLSLGVFLCVGFYLTARELLTGRATTQMRINIMGIILIFATTLIDLLYYRLTNNVSTYGVLGFLLYTVIIGTTTIRRSRRILQMAQENEIYRKLAFTDELTGLFNRAAFNRDMKQRQAELSADGRIQTIPTVIFMFDLNNLKQCNDGFGHDRGDQYLTSAASIIEHTFGSEGRCYRIGGDEFCAVIPFISRSNILNLLNVLRRKIREQNNRTFVVPIEIATGYAIYDPSIDQDLSDTKKRADEAMYQNKEQLKNILRKNEGK